MLADGLVESLADLGVSERLVQRPAGEPDACCGQAKTARIDALQGHLQTLADGAKALVVRNAHVRKRQDADLGAEVTHDRDRRHHRKSSRLRVDEETRDAALALRGKFRVGHRKDHRIFGIGAVGDPLLRSIDHPTVAIADRFRLHGEDVRARIGLAQAETESLLAARQPRQITFPDLGGEIGQNRRQAIREGRRNDHGMNQDAARAAMGREQPVEIDRRNRAKPAASDLLRPEHGIESLPGRALAHLATERVDLGREPAPVVVDRAFACEDRLVGVLERHHFLVDEADEALANGEDFLRNVDRLHVRSCPP